jgi:hypothetical protein
MPVRIQKSYDEYIRGFDVSFRYEIKGEVVVFPPCNAKNNNTNVESRHRLRAQAEPGEKPLPSGFDWRKNHNIHPVIDQHNCGCCWAVSVATCISDKFVVAGLVPFNPMVSYTFLLSCWNNFINTRCNGSNPALAVQYVSEFGAITESVPGADYSWCQNLAKNCTKKDTGEPRCLCATASGTEDLVRLSRSIPSCSGFQSPQNVRFFVSKPYWYKATREILETEPARLEAGRTFIKKHIMKYGPVVGGYDVYRNNQNTRGDFSCRGLNPAGIYLENVDYTRGVYEPLDLTTKAGSHAVVIVGWGEAEVSDALLRPDGPASARTTVPYWIVRNSWGTAYGEKGYFKMAMYPFNQHSQFDLSITIVSTVFDDKTRTYNTETVLTGGIIMFEPVDYGKKLTVSDYHTTTNKNVGTLEFYRPAPQRCVTAPACFVGFLVVLTLLVFFFILLDSSVKRSQDRQSSPSEKD